MLASLQDLCNNVHMALKYVLLTLLNRKRSTGYEIVKSFETAVGYFWSASHQQVYRELAKLTDSELLVFAPVVQGDKPDKKVYRITASGKRELRKWIEEPIAESPGKDLLLVKLLNINKANADTLLVELDRIAQIAAQRLEVYRTIEQMHYKPARVRKLALEDLSLYLALRKGIMSIETQMNWLDEARQSIVKTLGSQPNP